MQRKAGLAGNGRVIPGARRTSFEPLSTEQMLQKVREAELASHQKGKAFHRSWDTPLERYVLPLTNLEAYLEARLGMARKEGRMLRVFDAGIGSGRQWRGLLALQKGTLELFGNSLSLEYIVPELKGRIVECQSSRVCEKFVQGSFDIAVSRYGIHFEELESIVALGKLVGPGRDIFVVSLEQSMPDKETIARRCPDMVVVGEASDGSSRAYWIKKRPEP